MRRNAAPSKLFNINNKIAKTDEKTVFDLPVIDIIHSEGGCNFKYFTVAYSKPSKKKHKTWDDDGFLSISENKVILMNNEGKEIGTTMKKQLSKIIFEEGATFYIGGKIVEILSAVSSPNFTIEKIPTKENMIPYKSTFVNKEFRPLLHSNNDLRKSDIINNQVIMPKPSAGHIFRYNQSCSSVRDVILDPHLANRMRPHQIDGMIFLYECMLGLRPHGGSGAILADSMGLGKSVQTISVIWTLIKQAPYDSGPLIEKCVIVCPSSLVLNWKNEFEKWLGINRLQPYCVTGDNRLEKFIESPSNSVLILSYDMLIRNIDLVQELGFDLIVCDEAHRLKNTNIKISMAVESLKIPKRILLTGTPLQNDMDEFFALAEFSNPGVLGCDKETFRKRFVEPINSARQQNASQKDIDCGYEASLVLQRISQSFILRRTELVNSQYLPPKDELLVFCCPTPIQTWLYKIMIKCQIVQKHLSSSFIGNGGESLTSIILLRKLCNDPSFFLKHIAEKANNTENHNDESTLFDELYKSIKQMSEENEIYGNAISKIINGITGTEIYSGKLWVTVQMLMALGYNEKIILASHFTQTLDLLQKILEHLQLTFKRIDGNVSSVIRMRIVSDFNKSMCNVKPEVLLLSCKAGGEGLNLIGASKIILYDLDWNPATDLQTMGRIWRDGQKSRCTVYRLITTGTLEESLLQRQVTKQQLSTSLLDFTSSSNNQVAFSNQELKDIFTLHENLSDSSGCWTHILLNCCCQTDTAGSLKVIQRSPVNSFDLDAHSNCQLGLKMNQKASSPGSLAQLSSWNHWIGEKDIKNKCIDKLIGNAVNQISCIFMHTVNSCQD